MTNYRDLLLAERQSIHRRRNAQRACLRIELTSDALEAMRDATERDTAAMFLDADRNKLRQIDEALARIEAGTYGQCIACGEEIPAKRLKAAPWAEMCIPCTIMADHERAMGSQEAA
jgi:DnaK suppressor protein